MKKYMLGLFVGLLYMALSGNAFASDWGIACNACHGEPKVTSFDLPQSFDSLTVPIAGFTAEDEDIQCEGRDCSYLIAVSGYLITTTSTPPDAGDPGWQSSPPSAYTLDSDGPHTLYAWAKDAVNIVSAAVSDVVTISIASNSPPMADAGPDQSVHGWCTVTLDASNSDDRDDGIDSYLWEQVGGPVEVVISDPTAVQPTFGSPFVGPSGAALTFLLTVTDVNGATDIDTTIVNVSRSNIVPVADAGSDQTVVESTPVTLDGSSSNGVDDDIASYFWKQVDTNGVIAELSNPNASNPQFTITDIGPNGESLTFELTVTDDGGLKATDRCVVNVTYDNQAPVADAGADQTVAAGDEVTLEASGSYDPDNDLNTDHAYVWKQTAGSAVTLSAPGAVNPVFTAPAVADGNSETLVFELTVTDSGLLQATDTCEILMDGAGPVAVELPTKALMEKYGRLAEKYAKESKISKWKSKRYKKLYRRCRHNEPSASQAYLKLALNYKAQSLDAKWQAVNCWKRVEQIKKQLRVDRHENKHDRSDHRRRR